MERARALARRYLPDAARLLAGIAFAPDSEAALHTTMLCAKEIVAIAGVIRKRHRPRRHMRGLVTAVNQIDDMPQSAAAGSLAVQRRRERRREEWREQMKLSVLLDKYLDPTGTFWTSLENKPISRISGIFQKKRGVRSGIPDVFVLYLGRPIFVELKSRVGVATQSAETGPRRT